MSQTVHSLNWQADAIPVYTKGLLKAGLILGLNIYGAFSFFSTALHASHRPQPLTSAIGTASEWTSRNKQALLWWFHVTTNKSKKTPKEDESWPENVQNGQIFPLAGFVWLHCLCEGSIFFHPSRSASQYLRSSRNYFLVNSPLFRLKPCWFLLCQ